MTRSEMDIFVCNLFYPAKHACRATRPSNCEWKLLRSAILKKAYTKRHCPGRGNSRKIVKQRIAFQQRRSELIAGVSVREHNAMRPGVAGEQRYDHHNHETQMLPKMVLPENGREEKTRDGVTTIVLDLG